VTQPTLSQRIPALPGPHPARTLLAGLAVAAGLLLVLRFWVKDALPYFEFTAESYGRFWANSGWVLAHVIGGSAALLMGPLQFWSGLRRRHMSLHRWTGRLYLAGIAVGSATAFQLAFHAAGWTFGVALFTLGVVWLATSTAALIAALRRNIPAHRAWMLRSYLVTLAFVTFRLLLEIPALRALGTRAEVATTLGWLSWVLPLVGYELIRQARRDRLLG
jgi:hypothetical protein